MADLVRVQVLIPKEEADRFAAYCRKQGFKKSPLIARLVREYLDREVFRLQRDMFSGEVLEPKQS